MRTPNIFMKQPMAPHRNFKPVFIFFANNGELKFVDNRIAEIPDQNIGRTMADPLSPTVLQHFPSNFFTGAFAPKLQFYPTPF